jgi:hypothetical protein
MVVPTRFVLCRQVLIGIGKIDHACDLIPLKTHSWSRVRDHFGDHLSAARSQALECYPRQKLGGWLMDAKTFSLVAGLIFALVALLHLVRIFEEWPVIIGDWSVPKSVSWVALIVAGGLALVGLRLGQRE